MVIPQQTLNPLNHQNPGAATLVLAHGNSGEMKMWAKMNLTSKPLAEEMQVMFEKAQQQAGEEKKRQEGQVVCLNEG